MALDSYTNLKSAIGNWSSRPELTAEIVDAVTLFEAWANRLVRARHMETTATVTMTAGVGALPADYLQWTEIEWTGDPPRDLEWADRSYLTKVFPSSESGIPIYFVIEGSTISVMPVDDTSLRLRYYQKIPALSDAAPTNWLLQQHPDLYLFGGLTELSGLTQDLQAATAWKMRRDELAEEIRDAHQGLNSRGPMSIRPVGVPIV